MGNPGKRCALALDGAGNHAHELQMTPQVTFSWLHLTFFTSFLPQAHFLVVKYGHGGHTSVS